MHPCCCHAGFDERPAGSMLRRRARATTGASALGVTAILIWAAATLTLFLVAASNGDLQPMHWCVP